MLESQEPAPGRSPMTLTELQQRIRDTFGAKDASRGTAGTFMWFIEEVGELSDALRGNRPKEHVAAEFADTLAWLATLANIAGVDLEEAFRAKYGAGCPECHRSPCACGTAEKP
ncbi:MAG TPA: MazG nucleotide pyrophosphohydrolase domain-containing protein [Gemmataceae bacterium]|nr:MazG nucleotide pyrophosphohydrolase domain-containing protein [Gemmataceae bacterium]